MFSLEVFLLAGDLSRPRIVDSFIPIFFPMATFDMPFSFSDLAILTLYARSFARFLAAAARFSDSV